MSKELTITRAALKKIAKEAMRNSGITKEQRAKLTDVAETAETIVLHGWRLGNCGCLVGSAYPDYFRKNGAWRADHYEEAIVRVGEDFDYALHETILAGEDYEFAPRQKVKVLG